ncbi:hypothetical protein MTR67_001392, partial [Solanum verrucosum]
VSSVFSQNRESIGLPSSDLNSISIFYLTRISEGLFAESTGNQMATMPCTAKGHGWLRPAIGVVELSQCIIQASYWNGPGPGGLVIKSGKWAAGLNLGRSSRQDGTVRKGGEQELTYLIMSSSQGTGAIHKNSMVLKLHYMKV